MNRSLDALRDVNGLVMGKRRTVLLSVGGVMVAAAYGLLLYATTEPWRVYRRAGTETGVVFVGGGLRLASLLGQEVLVAFCSWKCHPIPYDHQHGLIWEWGTVNGVQRGIFRRVCSDTKDMIGRIERALKQADEGIVPYSRAAVLLLADELKTRKGLMDNQRGIQQDHHAELSPRVAVSIGRGLHTLHSLPACR